MWSIIIACFVQSYIMYVLQCCIWCSRQEAFHHWLSWYSTYIMDSVSVFHFGCEEHYLPTHWSFPTVFQTVLLQLFSMTTWPSWCMGCMGCMEFYHLLRKLQTFYLSQNYILQCFSLQCTFIYIFMDSGINYKTLKRLDRQICKKQILVLTSIFDVHSHTYIDITYHSACPWRHGGYTIEHNTPTPILTWVNYIIHQILQVHSYSFGLEAKFGHTWAIPMICGLSKERLGTSNLFAFR